MALRILRLPCLIQDRQKMLRRLDAANTDLIVYDKERDASVAHLFDSSLVGFDLVFELVSSKDRGDCIAVKSNVRCQAHKRVLVEDVFLICKMRFVDALNRLHL